MREERLHDAYQHGPARVLVRGGRPVEGIVLIPAATETERHTWWDVQNPPARVRPKGNKGGRRKGKAA